MLFLQGAEINEFKKLKTCFFLVELHKAVGYANGFGGMDPVKQEEIKQEEEDDDDDDDDEDENGDVQVHDFFKG